MQILFHPSSLVASIYNSLLTMCTVYVCASGVICCFSWLPPLPEWWNGEKKVTKGKTFCQHSVDAQKGKPLQTRTLILPPPFQACKGQGEHSVNSNHRHNQTRTTQRHTEWFLKWPVLLNLPVDDLPNVNNRNLKLDWQRLKQHY